MDKLTFSAVSRNYFNLPIWVAKHQGILTDEGPGADKRSEHGVASAEIQRPR
jgi:hypothetical protein